ncbi:MAG TPA: glyoxylate/hydroxypyruvate reductase A [Hyphomicrobiaceae bacterium]|nr:glyoxylate/hydroxypyruvate reductase A [Hyphomicrobiaceae bacterium]
MALMVIGSDRAADFFTTTRQNAPHRDIRLWPDTGAAEDIEFALAWHPPKGELRAFPNLKAIVSVGAGVDHLFLDPGLPDVPIVRYVDPDLTGRMVEYITLHTLLHARRSLEFMDLQRASRWQYLPEPAAHQVRVGIMGLGVLGQAAARALGVLGYELRGWSRTPKTVAGVKCFFGDAGLDEFLVETDILAVLLPLTPETRGILNRRLLQHLSVRGRHERLPGPVLINAGRGGLQVETDILAALEAGELYATSLDVFETEPLPQSSPLWQHPRVVITPHNAAESTDESIVAYFLRQVERVERGAPLENVVDPEAGY